MGWSAMAWRPIIRAPRRVIRQFERLFERQGVAFFGNVDVGEDVSLDDLRSLTTPWFLATGLATDRRLGIPGEDLPGVLASGRSRGR